MRHGADLAAALVTVVGAAGWTVACALALTYANRRVAGYDAASPGSAGMFCGVVPLGYVMLMATAVRVWLLIPVVVGVALWMLKRPELARQGRITLAYVAVPTCVGLWGLALTLLARL